MAAGIAPSEEFHDDGWIWRAPALQFSKLNRNPEIWNLKTVLFAVLSRLLSPVWSALPPVSGILKCRRLLAELKGFLVPRGYFFLLCRSRSLSLADL